MTDKELHNYLMAHTFKGKIPAEREYERAIWMARKYYTVLPNNTLIRTDLL